MKILSTNSLKYLLGQLKTKFLSSDDTTTVSTIGIDNIPTQNSNNLVKSGDVYSSLANKQNITSVVSETSPTAVTLSDNTEYNLSDVSNLTITFPNGNFECYLLITTADSPSISITLPLAKYIGVKPTFLPNQTWELSIKNGIVVAGKVSVLQ